MKIVRYRITESHFFNRNRRCAAGHVDHFDGFPSGANYQSTDTRSIRKGKRREKNTHNEESHTKVKRDRASTVSPAIFWL